MQDIIERFVSPSGGQLRVAVFDGEPWFVAKDVCEYFGDTNPRRQVSRLDEDERACRKMHTLGGTQEMTVINEAGLYHLLFLMHPKKARGVNEEQIRKRQERLTAFKRWVTHEVLPSIRKHGAYIAPEAASRFIEHPKDAVALVSPKMALPEALEEFVTRVVSQAVEREFRKASEYYGNVRRLEREIEDLKMELEELRPDAEAHRRWWKAWGDGMSRWRASKADPGQTRLWNDDREVFSGEAQ